MRDRGRDEAVEATGRPLTMHFGPDEALVNLDVKLRGCLGAADVGRAVEQIERRIRERHPDARRVFIEASALAEAAAPGGRRGPPPGGTA